MVNTVVLLEGALIANNMEDRAMLGQNKGLDLNLAALLWDILYQLQDEAIE